MGLGFSERYTFSHYAPFRYLKGSDVIDPPETDVLLEDSFESIWGTRKWLGLWMEEKGKVILKYDTMGAQNSRCLVIQSESKGEWARSHRKFIKVKKGDHFYYEALVQMKGILIHGHISVDGFDENMKPVKWNYVKTEVHNSDSWSRLEKYFTIIDDIKYIRFRIGGVGEGEFRFDDIKFRKISGPIEE